jgi:hypothetical protein
MARLIIEGLSIENAKLLAKVYQTLAESVVENYMLEHDLNSTNIEHDHEDGWTKVDTENQTVTLYTR